MRVVVSCTPLQYMKQPTTQQPVYKMHCSTPLEKGKTFKLNGHKKSSTINHIANYMLVSISNVLQEHIIFLKITSTLLVKISYNLFQLTEPQSRMKPVFCLPCILQTFHAYGNGINYFTPTQFLHFKSQALPENLINLIWIAKRFIQFSFFNNVILTVYKSLF